MKRTTVGGYLNTLARDAGLLEEVLFMTEEVQGQVAGTAVRDGLCVI